MNAIILVSNGLEECEALVTYDLLCRAGINTKLVGLQEKIESSHHLCFLPHLLIEEVNSKEVDCLILPGGMPGTKNLEENPLVSKMIDEFAKDNKYIAAICAAPSILLHKNLLHNEKFVCYPGFESGYTPSNAKAIQDGKFITAKGLGAAFEFSYLLISNLVSKQKADEVMKAIQF